MRRESGLWTLYVHCISLNQGSFAKMTHLLLMCSLVIDESQPFTARTRREHFLSSLFASALFTGYSAAICPASGSRSAGDPAFQTLPCMQQGKLGSVSSICFRSTYSFVVCLGLVGQISFSLLTVGTASLFSISLKKQQWNLYQSKPELIDGRVVGVWERCERDPDGVS